MTSTRRTRVCKARSGGQVEGAGGGSCSLVRDGQGRGVAAELRPHHSQGVCKSGCCAHLDAPPRQLRAPSLRSLGPAREDARLAERAQGLRRSGMEEPLPCETDGRESPAPRGRGAGEGRGQEHPPHLREGAQSYDWRCPRGHLRLGFLMVPKGTRTGPREPWPRACDWGRGGWGAGPRGHWPRACDCGRGLELLRWRH